MFSYPVAKTKTTEKAELKKFTTVHSESPTPKPSFDIINATIDVFDLEMADIEKQLEQIEKKRTVLLARKQTITEMYEVAKRFPYLKPVVG